MNFINDKTGRLGPFVRCIAAISGICAAGGQTPAKPSEQQTQPQTKKPGIFDSLKQSVRDAAKQAKDQMDQAARGAKAGQAAPQLNIGTNPGTNPGACSTLSKWSARFVQEYPAIDVRNTVLGALYPKFMNLFEDAYFSGFFGRPFDQLTGDQRKEIATGFIRQCFSNPQVRATLPWQEQLTRPFMMPAGSLSEAEVLAGIQERRVTRRDLQLAVAQLNALPVEAATFDKAKAMEPQKTKADKTLWPSESSVLDQAYEDAKRRGAEPALAARVQAAISSAAGTDDFSPLDRFSKDNAELLAAVGSQSAAASQARIDAKREEVLSTLLAGERAKLNTLPTGLEGLRQGAAWYRSFESRFGGRRNADVAQLERQFQQSRAQALTAAQPELTRRARLAKSRAEVDTLLASYLSLPSDQDSPAAAAVQQIAQTRQDQFDREMALGRKTSETPPPAAPVQPAPSAPVVTVSGAGREPTEEEMYNALKDLLDGVNSNMAEIEQACRSGRVSDPIMGMQCAVGAMSTGGRGGIRAKITNFRKIACEKASGRAGYVCDYAAAIAISGMNVPPSMRRMMDQGEVTQKRFVWNGTRWLALP